MTSFIAKKTDIFSRIDPDHIYVENIRAFFGFPYKFAKFLCDMAVKDKYFQKCYGVKCPGCDRIIESYSSIEDIPQEIECDVCQGLERERYSYTKDQLKVVEFYRLIK